MIRGKSGFKPTEKMEVQQTAEGTPKYVPVTVMGMPVYTEDKKMVMKPALKIPPNVMIEWLKTEYPDSAVEFVRHTEKPIVTEDRIVYPPEVFECRIWLNGRRGDEPFDGNGFARRTDDDYSEFDPMGSARTGSFISAMRFLGFGCDIKYEELSFSYNGVEPRREVEVRDKNFEVKKVGEGLYIESGRGGETLSEESVSEMVEAIKERRKSKALKPDPIKDPVPVEAGIELEEAAEKVFCEEEKPAAKEAVEFTPVEAEPVPADPPKKKRGRPKKVKTETPDIFSDSRISEIADVKFVVEEEAPEMMKKCEGMTFAEIYQTNIGLLTTIARVSFKYEGKVPYEMIEYARKVVDVQKEING